MVSISQEGELRLFWEEGWMFLFNLYRSPLTRQSDFKEGEREGKDWTSDSSLIMDWADSSAESLDSFNSCAKADKSADLSVVLREGARRGRFDEEWEEEASWWEVEGILYTDVVDRV